MIEINRTIDGVNNAPSLEGEIYFGSITVKTLSVFLRRQVPFSVKHAYKILIFAECPRPYCQHLEKI